MGKKRLKRFGSLSSKTPILPTYVKGTKPPLRAKSWDRGGDTLTDHSFEAACMALTVATNVIIDTKEREALYRASFVAGLFHDFGKTAAGFQEMIKVKQVHGWPKNQGGFRHEMISALLLLFNCIDNPIWSQREIQAMFLAIIVHHKPYRRMNNFPKPIPKDQWPQNLSFKQMVAEMMLNKKLLRSDWKGLVEKIGDDAWGRTLIDSGYLPHDLRIPQSVEEADTFFSDFIDNQILPGYNRGFIDEFEMRRKLSPSDIKFISFVRATVTVGDHLSSGKYLFVPPKPDLKAISALKSGHSPRGFQKMVGATSGNLMLQAPTGSGKTEAAYMWLQYNQEYNDQLAKVFFVLPYQASINAMYHRLNTWLGVTGGIVGTQHSRAANFLFDLFSTELYGKTDHPERQKFREYGNPWNEIGDLPVEPKPTFSKLILDKGYDREIRAKKKVLSPMASAMNRLTQEIFYPIKVTTPHQLLAAALGGKGWEVKIQDFEGACIVFDEIHSYDPLMVGLVLGLSKMLTEQFSCKLLFMSASFPQFLITKIRQLVDTNIEFCSLNPKDPEDQRILDKNRHIIKLLDQPLTQYCCTDEFKNIIKTSTSILIVCNTVMTAQTVYQSIKPGLEDDQIMLFHSRFKIKDRREKEKKILDINNNPLKIVVATQVVEVSLDIDFEIGIIEGAPLDALIQRFGRVNRAGDRPLDGPNLFICPPEGYSHKIYQTQLTESTLELLQRTELHEISETNLVDMLDELYLKHPWSENEEREFLNAFNHNNYQNFFKSAIPGTYNNWIDTVITDTSTQDIILRKDIGQFRKLLEQNPLEASSLIIPARVYPPELEWIDNKLPPVLKEEPQYSKEIGLIKQ